MDPAELARIFANLTQQSLYSIRLVCRELRSASVPNIRLAEISTTCLSMARQQLDMLPDTNNVTLSAELHSVDNTALACLRACAPRIRQLHICAACNVLHCKTHDQAAIKPWRLVNAKSNEKKFAKFKAVLAQATRLTSLGLLCCEDLAAPLLADLSNLQELRVVSRRVFTPKVSELIGALARATGLRTLSLVGVRTPIEWSQLLPALAQLPSLRSLEQVYVGQDGINVALVTALRRNSHV